MMPLVAILSTSDWSDWRDFLAPSTFLASRFLRMLFRPVRRRARSARLCSRRLMFCRLALRADLLRFATVYSLCSRMKDKHVIISHPGDLESDYAVRASSRRPE